MLTHEAVMNRLLWMQNAYPITKNDIILQKLHLVLMYLFGNYLAGLLKVQYYIFRKWRGKDPQRIIELINSQNISKLHFVPSMLNVFLEFCERKQRFFKKSLA